MKRLIGRGALRLAMLCLMCFALAPATARAQAILHATREGDMIRVDVSVFWHDMPAQWVAVAVQRWTVGLCDDETIVTPAPWPREVPAPLEPASDYSFLTPVPGDNRCFGYGVKALDADGQLSSVGGAGEMPFDFVTCGQAIVARGYLLVDTYAWGDTPILQACEVDCWHSGIWINLSGVDPATYTAYVTFMTPGIPVDIYGRIEVSDLLPNVDIVATQVVPTPSGQCGPLPVTQSSWGQLKNGYR